MTESVILTGVELSAHEAKERRKIQVAAEEKAKEEEASAMESMILGIEDYDSDDSAEEVSGGGDETLIRGSFKIGFGAFATPRYPMFFFQETKKEHDAYGEIIDPETYMDKFSKTRLQAAKRKNADNMMLMPNDENAMDVEDTSQQDDLSKNVPTKKITTIIDLQVVAKLVYVDFEGLADGRAIRNCIAHVKPRKLILVHGTPETTLALKNFALKSINYCDAVFTPKAMECVDIESDTNVYKLQIKESLYSSARFERVGNHEVAYLSAKMNFPPNASIPILEPQMEENPGHDPILVSHGNIKLDAVKQALSKEGFASHFRGGMLVCSDGVVLKRTKANCIIMEGVMSEKYFQIRNILYSQYTLI